MPQASCYHTDKDATDLSDINAKKASDVDGFKVVDKKKIFVLKQISAGPSKIMELLSVLKKTLKLEIVIGKRAIPNS